MRQRTNKSRLWLRITAVMLLITAWPVSGMAKTDFQKAQQLLEQGRITEARRALQSELRINPRNIEARYELAVLLEDIEHQRDAMTLYEKNLRLAWHLPSLINLASLLERRGQTKQARRWLESATKKMRHEAAPWYVLAAMSEKEGHLKTAIAQHKHALKADPLNGFAWLHFAEFQSRNNLADKGVKHARKAIQLLANCAPCWRSYGDILQHIQRNNQALSAYQRSLAIRPDSQTRQRLITALRHLGRTDRARRMQQALDAWHKHHPDQ